MLRYAVVIILVMVHAFLGLLGQGAFSHCVDQSRALTLKWTAAQCHPELHVHQTGCCEHDEEPAQPDDQRILITTNGCTHYLLVTEEMLVSSVESPFCLKTTAQWNCQWNCPWNWLLWPAWLDMTFTQNTPSTHPPPCLPSHRWLEQITSALLRC